MPVRCAVCETDNLEDASECAGCGSPIAAPASSEPDGPPLPGLERTHAAAVDVEVDAIAGLDATGIDSRGLEIETEEVPGVERTLRGGGRVRGDLGQRYVANSLGS